MSTDPAQVRMDTIREQAAEFDEYDSRAKALLAFRCNGHVITGGELVHSYACLMHPAATASKPGVPFGAVDAARENLAAEKEIAVAEAAYWKDQAAQLEAEMTTKCLERDVARRRVEDCVAIIARVTAERDQARATITAARNWVCEELDEIENNPDVSSGEAIWEEGGYASALRNVMSYLDGSDD